MAKKATKKPTAKSALSFGQRMATARAAKATGKTTPKTGKK